MNIRVFLKAPVEYEAKKAVTVWELDKVMYGLEEVMAEFNDRRGHGKPALAGLCGPGGRRLRNARR